MPSKTVLTGGLLSKGQRTILKRRLEENGDIPYANAQAEGFGFSLVRAVTRNQHNGDVEADHSDRILARFRHLAVETSLGYWLPQPYAEIVRASVREAEEQAEFKLSLLADRLQNIDMMVLTEALQDHVAGMMKLLPADVGAIKPRDDLKEAFEKFVAIRKMRLNDENARHRLARTLQLTRMPDFWSDTEAVKEFETSFFDNITSRLQREGNTPFIVRVFRSKLGGAAADPDEFKEQLASYLERSGWGAASWPAPKDKRTSRTQNQN